jgi:hypothetical protein
MPGKNIGKEDREARAWNLKDIEQLLDLLVAREISEFEMEKDGLRLRIRRGVTYQPAPGGAGLSVQYAGPLGPAASSPGHDDALNATEHPATMTP